MTSRTHHIDRSRCSDLEAGRRLEWLVTNGRGGYAMAAANQMLTRRYHGLLVAAIHPPVERFVLLAKLDASVTLDGSTYELATNDYPGAVHPRGYRFLDSLCTLPYPTWRWRVGAAVIEQTLCMTHGEDTTFVRYRLLEGRGPVTLSLHPLCTSRHFHALARHPDIGTPTVETGGDRLVLRWPDDRPAWQLSHNGTFHSKPDWYDRFILATEARRGYDFTQDLFTPGAIAATLQSGDSAGLVVAASTQHRSWHEWVQAFAQAVSGDTAPLTGAAAHSPRPQSPIVNRQSSIVRPQSPIPNPQSNDPLLEPLMRAARAFLVCRGGELRTIIAGYPWFGDWGRDTFISLPGICLVTGRFDDARRIIQAFARHVDGGMIPNRFPDFGDTPAYNTADATLWYVHAIDRYLTYSGDGAFVFDQMFPVITDILDAHLRGTRHGIRSCEDGLLAAGEPGLALTWMDAQPAGRSVTPRIGKPVEINALWYNALRIGASYADHLGAADRAQRWRERAARVRASFNERFWNASARCLYDVVDGDGGERTADGSIRPNQLLAISLTHPVLHERCWRDVVAVCERELWTPMGLRTLSPSDPAYRGRYEGDVASRDSAYHRGTVWPWLLGPFVTAYVRAAGTPDPASRLVPSRSSSRGADAPPERAPGLGRGADPPLQDDPARATRFAARRFLDGLGPHLGEAGIGSVGEVADGDSPHTPGGCPWQAWSVAEPLRALCEDILATHPPQAHLWDRLSSRS